VPGTFFFFHSQSLSRLTNAALLLCVEIVLKTLIIPHGAPPLCPCQSDTPRPLSIPQTWNGQSTNVDGNELKRLFLANFGWWECFPLSWEAHYKIPLYRKGEKISHLYMMHSHLWMMHSHLHFTPFTCSFRFTVTVFTCIFTELDLRHVLFMMLNCCNRSSSFSSFSTDRWLFIRSNRTQKCREDVFATRIHSTR